jgi:hypothetical protein
VFVDVVRLFLGTNMHGDNGLIFLPICSGLAMLGRSYSWPSSLKHANLYCHVSLAGLREQRFSCFGSLPRGLYDKVSNRNGEAYPNSDLRGPIVGA